MSLTPSHDAKPVIQVASEATNTPAAVTLAANTSATLLAANRARIRFTISNILATTLYVRKGAAVATAAAGGYDIAIPASTTYMSDPGEYTGEIRGICATAGDISVSQSTYG